MARFNIDVELDWFNNKEYTIDEEIRERVVRGVESKLLEKATSEVVKKLDGQIAEKLEEAMQIIEQRVDDFVSVITEERIEKIKIPQKESKWSDEVKFVPISEFVGQQYEKHITKKIYNDDYEIAGRYEDKEYSMSEKCIRDYLDKTLSEQVSEMVKKAQKDAEDTVLKTLEQNLKENLVVDTINRMNIPKLLENLQQKALDFGKEEESEKFEF